MRVKSLFAALLIALTLCAIGAPVTPVEAAGARIDGNGYDDP